MSPHPLLHGAWDSHLHFAPDSVPRAQDAASLFLDAKAAGMCGLVLKSHTAPTAITAHSLNAVLPDGPRFFGSITLNPSVGGLNPNAVSTALDAGATVVWFPTYSSALHVRLWGKNAAYPQDPFHPEGLTILDDNGRLLPEVHQIIDIIAENDAVLATGHLSVEEIFTLLPIALKQGVKRCVVTHASERTPGMTIDEQKRAIDMGAWIEHCLLVITPCCPDFISWEEFTTQLRGIDSSRTILSTDFGQVANGPIIPGFSACLTRLQDSGFDDSDLRRMIADNPHTVHSNRSWSPPWQCRIK